MSEKVYSRIIEAEEMVKALCEKQPEVLWCVRPNMVAVMGIENKERSEKNKVLAKIKPIKGCEKAILQANNIDTRYIIEAYWSDWREWDEKKRQWIIFHELLHIHSEIGKTIKHDCEDFKLVLDKVGVNWIDSKELPNLILGDVKFNLELRPSMEEVDEEAKDEIDEEEVAEKKKRGRPKKEEVKKEEAKAVQKDDANPASEEGEEGEEPPKDTEEKDGDIF